MVKLDGCANVDVGADGYGLKGRVQPSGGALRVLPEVPNDTIQGLKLSIRIIENRGRHALDHHQPQTNELRYAGCAPAPLHIEQLYSAPPVTYRET
eukprot:8861065-Pyramimonas_sp.AAC.1